MVKAIRIHETGGPEVLKIEHVNVNAPGEGEVLVAQTAIGINFIDTYHRKGLYPLPLPATLGIEACGYVEAIGAGVSGLNVGDRVAYATGTVGAYTTERVIEQRYLVHVPDGISDEEAAAGLAKGLTAHYLLHRAFVIRPGSSVILVHAAAGGVGQLLCQWASVYDCTVIGTVSSEEKAAIARENGCTHVINYRTENFVERVMEITHGLGVSVVYDSVGKDTFLDSLQCLQPFGMMISYGQSSGAVPPFDISLLAEKNIFLTRPTLSAYKRHRMELILSAEEVFERLKNGHIRLNIHNHYDFEDIAQAHRDLESRQTTGASVLMV